MMKSIAFVEKLRMAFGNHIDMPIAFWRSNEPVVKTEKIGGCFFKGLRDVRNGKPLSLEMDNVGCMGGKFYLGFTEMPVFVPEFVSLKERYKNAPDDVLKCLEDMEVKRNPYRFFNFERIDRLDLLDGIEGVLFFANPDVLAGLCGWAFYDNNHQDAVVSRFGSGCSALVSSAITENSKGGDKCFLGLFDPSVRPYVAPDELGFAIPFSRLVTMAETIDRCFLSGAHAWKKVKERIEG